jgi:hypothetical protein
MTDHDEAIIAAFREAWLRGIVPTVPGDEGGGSTVNHALVGEFVTVAGQDLECRIRLYLELLGGPGCTKEALEERRADVLRAGEVYELARRLSEDDDTQQVEVPF